MLVARTQWADWYACGGESAVLIDDQIIVLSELATALVACVGETAVLVASLAEILVRSFGHPAGNLLESTQSVVNDLIESGVLLVVTHG